MNFFVDSSFLIALFNESDDFHQKATQLAREKDLQPSKYFISNVVLAESVNLVFRSGGSSVAKSFLKAIRGSLVEEIFLTPEIFSKGYNTLFKQESKKGLNLFDCFHLATMKHLGIDTILTFDGRFNKEVKVLP